MLARFHALLDEEGFTAERFVMGRSLGSLPAAELAATAHERLAGLIIESGAPDLARLRQRGGVDESDAEIAELIEAHAARLAPIRSARAPHPRRVGRDRAARARARVSRGSSRPTGKQLVIIPGAGHNDIGWVGRELYFEALARFIARN